MSSSIQYSKDNLTIGAGSTVQDLIVFPAPYVAIKMIYVNPALNCSIILQENSSKKTIIQSDFRNMPLDGFYLDYQLAIVREFILTIVSREAGAVSFYPTFHLIEN